MASKVYSDIDLSLKTTFRNDIRKKVNLDAINQHLKLLMLTEQDEIPFMNNVSADIRNLLFMPYNIHIRNTLNEVMRNIISQYEKRIEIIKIDNNLVNHNLNITLEYKVKQTNTVGQFSTILKKTR